MRFAYISALLAALWPLASASHADAATVPLTLVRAFSLPISATGNFDHLAADTKRGRIFVTAKDGHALLVLDEKQGRVVATLRGMPRPHAVLYRSDLDRLYVTDGTAGTLNIFDGASYRLLARIRLHVDADSIGYDPSKKLLYVDNGGKAAGSTFSLVSVIDTTAMRRLADIHVDGDTLEAMALDAYRPRLYVNDPAQNRVVVIDRWTRTVIASWPLTLGHDNVAMALDEAHERLFVGCSSGTIVVFDSTTGKERESLPSVRGMDDLMFDRSARRLYAAGRTAIASYAQIDADHYTALPRVATRPGASTALLLPQQSAYYTVFPGVASRPATLAEFRTATVWSDPAPAAEFAYAPHAPAAERLVLSTLSRHRFLRKIGLHGVPPGKKISILLANGNETRLGIETTSGDFAAVRSGRFYGPLIQDGAYYNVKLPLFDAAKRRIGIIVMEIPQSAVPNEAGAERTAYAVRSEVSSQIPSLAALFER
jgi:DNA-binding beta-propeller fold protein YncE